MACKICSDSLTPLDKFLDNKVVEQLMDKLAYEVCMKEGIEGGKKEVCYGAIHDMTISLIPSLAAGVLSPQRVCDEVLHLCKSPDIKEISSDQYVK